MCVIVPDKICDLITLAMTVTASPPTRASCLRHRGTGLPRAVPCSPLSPSEVAADRSWVFLCPPSLSLPLLPSVTATPLPAPCPALSHPGQSSPSPGPAHSPGTSRRSRAEGRHKAQALAVIPVTRMSPAPLCKTPGGDKMEPPPSRSELCFCFSSALCFLVQPRLRSEAGEGQGAGSSGREPPGLRPVLTALGWC